MRKEYEMMEAIPIRQRQWDDYLVVTADDPAARFLRGYIERFNTVSFFNEFAGLLSFFFVMGQICSPFMRIPIHGTFIDCRVHVYWIQQSRTGKSIAWEFTDRLLEALEIESESFTAGSDAKLIGTVESQPVMEDGRPTGEVQHITVPGLLNGYKTLLFDEASILLNDAKSHFSDKILYLQQAMAPLGSRTNVLVKHLVGGSVRTPSGVSLWMTTYPPKDIMNHVLEKGFFQRVFLFQNDISPEQRQTVSEHRMGGLYVPVNSKVMDYDVLAEYLVGCVDLLKNRLFDAMGLEGETVEVMNEEREIVEQTLSRNEVWGRLSDGEREDAAMLHAHDIFKVSPGYNPAILNTLDEYYGLINSISSESVRETALSFEPNIENYTAIFANLIAVLYRSDTITEDHVMMASEIIFDNMHNLIIWLEQKQNVKDRKRIAAERAAWMQAFNQCNKHVNENDGSESVLQQELLAVYGSQQSIAGITAGRRFKTLREGGNATVGTVGGKWGKRNFVSFSWGG
tara:strand:+ start:789 stop:2327 length:1539 start_codon:yes stop_codon:yes gene_type:complete